MRFSLADKLKIDMTRMAINNQETLGIWSLRPGSWLKDLLQPFQPIYVICPAILCNSEKHIIYILQIVYLSVLKVPGLSFV